MRTYLSEIIFRIFHTYVVDDCDPSNATYKIDKGGQPITNDKLCAFSTDLVNLYRKFSVFSPSLSELSDIFISAAKKAEPFKVDKEEYEQKNTFDRIKHEEEKKKHILDKFFGNNDKDEKVENDSKDNSTYKNEDKEGFQLVKSKKYKGVKK